MGRIIETGEVHATSQISTFEDLFISNGQSTASIGLVATEALEAFLNNNSRQEVTRTYYSHPLLEFGLPAYFDHGSGNLRNRIASVANYETYDGDDLDYLSAIHYRYDIHGNVSDILNDIPALSLSDARFTHIEYEYELVSGNVRKVKYQSTKPDQFYHRYFYDAENRLKAVETSVDDAIWQTDATYFYYDHGPLARVELGDNKVQGLDYYYTLQGWLKGVNSNTLAAERDPGKDGLVADAENMNRSFSKDVYGFSLHYFDNDYTPVGAAQNWNVAANRPVAETAGSQFVANRSNLFNGNITSMTTALQDSTGNLTALGNIYTYDQLNRLVGSQSFHNLDSAANAFESSGAVANMYANRFTYDANGNIESQVRADEAGTEFDRLTYRYYDVAGERVHNRLYHVNDSASNALAADDIDDMGAFSGDTLAANINLANNYGYDAIGQLFRDEQEGIDSIIWRADGKIKEIIRSAPATGSHLRFMYDPLGNRLAKIELNTQGQEARSTWYQRDAQGNPLSVYTREVDYQAQTATFAQTEKIIYGSQRLGMRIDTVEVQSATMPGLERPFIAGNTRYELSNHLGNVLTTISGKRLAHGPDSGTATHYTTPVLSASDYSPFGAPLHGRTWSGGYRYGFNGMEKDDEVRGSGNHIDFGARGYDPRLGRWLSVDPSVRKYPAWSPYVYALNNPLRFTDPDGKDPVDVINMLNNYVKAVDKQLNNIYQKSYFGKNKYGGTGEEWFGVGVIKVSSAQNVEIISLKHVETIHEYSGTKINYSTEPEEKLVFDFHTHHGKYPGQSESFEGMAFSGRDIYRVGEAIDQQDVGQNWTSMVEAGTTRFALVVLDVDKAKTFFDGKDLKQFNDDWQKEYNNAYEANSGDHQGAIIAATLAIVGDGSKSGIGFYQTTDDKKQSFEKVEKE